MTKIIAAVPILGREPLVPHTIKNLLKSVDKVICVCQNKRDAMICDEAGAFVINSRAVPLGQKWNYGFQAAKQFDPDFVLYAGSDDWMINLDTNLDADIVGARDYYLMHLQYQPLEYLPVHKKRFIGGYDVELINSNLLKRKVGHWKGYKGDRKGEPVGGGRLLSREFLNKIDWSPFADGLNKNLDHSMYLKAKSVKLRRDNFKLLSISTSLWGRKHPFAKNADRDFKFLDDRFLKKYFPESFNLF